ncbi:MAG TPA: PIG-L family deacetylase [Thermoanaerobaculia bacterium]|nr:PIG-L family deacetylase [Thermoanaerobaculia bacterium]
MSFIEHELVPFNPEVLRGEKLLVLAPHPDDEIIGSGGLIAQHIREKREVRVIVITDGGAAGPEGGEDYREKRRRESIEALAMLGVVAPRFLGIPDREIGTQSEQLQRAIREELEQFRPDLVVAPSPLEVHPDHLSTARALSDLIQTSAASLGELALCRVAFCEITQPFRPNVLVDVTDVAEEKYEAIRAHRSQLDIRDYESYARGLNQFRAMTLPPECRYAEGYWVAPLASLHTTAWTELAKMVGGIRPIEVTPDALPITVVVRTKDRPAQLLEAVASIKANALPATVVVVNDGGESPRELLRNTDVTLIEQEQSLGRSMAANAGANAATSGLICFLDDDDLMYDDHLETLAAAFRAAENIVPYTDAISSFMESGDDGHWKSAKQLRLYGRDFDPEFLLIDNYIPLPALLLRRDDFLELGGFDRELDLFEDWDFLIRLSGRRAFRRIPRITCEIRHFPSAQSAIVSNPEGSEAFRSARLAIWNRHPSRLDQNVMANVFERQKKELNRAYTATVESAGRARHLELDTVRLERDKRLLLDELDSQGRARADLESLRAELQTRINKARAQVDAQAGQLSERERALAETQGEAASLRDARDAQESLIARLYDEIERLNGLLELIYRSKTWRLHRTMEKLRGKGE